MELLWPSGGVMLDHRVVVILSLVGALIVIFAGRAVLIAQFSPLKKIPGPFLARYSRLWELSTAVQGKMHRRTVELHEQYGPVVRFAPNKYCFNSAQAVKTIYVMGGSFPKSAYYEAFAEPGARKALFNDRNNQQHARLRRTQASLYSMTTIKSYEPYVDKQNAVLEQKLQQFAATRETVSLPNFLQKYAFDVIGEMTFGQSFDLMNNPRDELGLISLIHRNMLLSSTFGVVPEFWRPLIAFLKRLRLPSPKLLYEVSSKFLNQTRASGKVKDLSDDSLATFTDKIIALETKGSLQPWEGLSVCVNNVIAGSDTTAISLNAALYHIYTMPRILKYLRDEIDSFAKRGQISNPITFAEAQSLPYLQALINETLRIHPAVGVPLPRDVPQGGANIDGYFFPQGTEVGVNAWGLSYNKDLYGSDVNDFRPERWFENTIGTTTSAINQFAFGGGSRTCIGKNISLLEMTKVIPQIVRKFDIIIDPKTMPWSLATHWFVKQQFNSTITLRTDEKN